MASDPLAGLAEIQLEALQPGSSIMPGKVNPVLPEAVLMAVTEIIGNDSAITLAAQSGNFQHQGDVAADRRQTAGRHLPSDRRLRGDCANSQRLYGKQRAGEATPDEQSYLAHRPESNSGL